MFFFFASFYTNIDVSILFCFVTDSSGAFLFELRDNWNRMVYCVCPLLVKWI